MQDVKIKICGITRLEEAELINKYPVDFVGMVLFFPKSKRNITMEQAKMLMDALRPDIKKTAVVVSPGVDEVRQIEEAGFDYIQIHGRLCHKVLSSIHIPVLKAFNITDIEQYEKCRQYPQIAGYVFDAQEPGSGKPFDWKLVENIPRDGKLFLLAGGLNADNVREAIAFVQPDGVDVSSGVEYDGMLGKDPEKIERFVANIRGARDVSTDT